MSDFKIRAYNPDIDYPAVQANLQQAELFDPDRDTEERLRKFASSVIVAEIDEQVVGSVYMVDHIVSTLFRLVVNEDYRQRGIGTALVGSAKKQLSEAGAKDLELFFDDSNTSLEVWYDKLGFEYGGLYSSMWSYTNSNKQ